MKVTFYSNFLTHHQIPFCMKMQKKLGDDFKLDIEKINDVIEIVCQVPSNNAKDYIENANIFIGTSDSSEGWGVITTG